MRYLSTRGGVQGLSFEDAVMTGLADDGGLLVPEHIPTISEAELASWKSLSFSELSWAILSKYIEGEIPEATLRSLVDRSYASFSHPEVTPLQAVGNLHILELFHGPTFAFKDVALQFLGNLFEHFLKASGKRLTVVGATSGDTGSAAIYGLRGKENIDAFILFPKGRVSPVQELQMTSVLDANIHNIAIEGHFDDAQAIVKGLFRDLEFKKAYSLGAVNSINWARILAQMVYYVYSYLRHPNALSKPVTFCVPTGNFGDVLAGFYAKQMGLPIERLVVATNKNDILYRFFQNSEYDSGEVSPSLSPAMDIQASSNFERFLYYLSGENAFQLKQWMEEFQETSRVSFPRNVLEQARVHMDAERVDDEQTLSTMEAVYQEYGYLLDPHTAVGVTAALGYQGQKDMICLATAHPAKFQDAVQQAINKPCPGIPDAIAALQDKETRYTVKPAKADAVQVFIQETLKR